MKRIGLALIAGIFLLVSYASAQDMTLGLSAPDALLIAAANGAPLDSFAFNYTAHVAEDLDTFAVSADFTGSGAVDRAAAALMATVSGQVTLGNAQTISLDAETRLLDDTLYLDAGGDWQALEDAPTAAADLIGDFTGLSVDTMMLSGWNLYGVDGLDDFLTAIAAQDLSSFVSAKRLDDENVGDVPTAHFQITADLHALFDSDAFVDAIVALSQAQGSDLIIRTRDEVAEMLRANNEAIDPATLTIEEYVGLDDSLIHRIAVNLVMQIAPAAAGYVDAPFAVDLDFDATLSGHNQPPSIIAPDDSSVVSAFTLPEAVVTTPEGDATQWLFTGTLDENAVDTYPLEAQAGDTVTITVRRLSLDFDPLITLLSPGGETLIDNDDHEAAIFFAADYDAQIADFPVPDSGTYSLEVTDSYGGAGSYLLTITVRH